MFTHLQDWMYAVCSAHKTIHKSYLATVPLSVTASLHSKIINKFIVCLCVEISSHPGHRYLKGAAQWQLDLLGVV